MGAIILSVINQMLKDLDKRQNEQTNKAESTANAMMATPKSPKMSVIIIVTIGVTLLLTYGGYLFTQNKQLISEKNSRTELKKAPLASKQQHNEQARTNESNANNVAQQVVLENGQKVTLIPGSNANINSLTVKKTVTEQSVTSKAIPVQAEKAISQKSLATSVKQSEPRHLSEVKEKSQITKNDVDTQIAEPEQARQEIKTQAIKSKPKASISVSRQQLTTEQLAQQKMKQAEQALSAHDMRKAEKLFEEVLMLKPDNKAARKQLAALWFGRKAYQDALNLLAQGIALDPQYSEFRLMQARIYLTQGYSEQAYQVLQALPFTLNIEYLSTQANVAQQLAKYPQAIQAYQQLIKIQPSEARWWLGLAVAYDSNKQYSLALSAYQSALAQGNLSASSLDFVQQRLQELRE